MVAIPTPPPDRPTAEQAARRVEAALAAAAVLHDRDDDLDALDGDPDKLARAARLHAAWREWLGQAAPIYEAAEGVEGIDPERLRELYVERCMIDALLRMSPEEEARLFEAARCAEGSDEGASLDETRERIAEWRRATGIPKPVRRLTTRRMGGQHAFHLAEDL